MIITAEPRSDQWNADDFVQGPQTFTITGVEHGKAEQKYDIKLEGADRVWRPPVTVLRLLISGWGNDATKWAGHQVTLYRDPNVTFGPNKTGGIRVSHMSHIDGPIEENLTVTRGKRNKFTVQPLDAEAPAKTTDRILADEWISVIRDAGTIAQLEAAWNGAKRADVAREPDVIAAKDKRKTELKEN